MMNDPFNATPIMLRHPSSMVADEKSMIMKLNQPRFLDDDDVDEDYYETIDVPQHLAPELYQYEFPPKSRLEALAELDKEDPFSFFDESSFTTASTSSVVFSSLRGEDNHGDDLFDDLDSLPKIDVREHLDRFFASTRNVDEPWGCHSAYETDSVDDMLRELEQDKARHAESDFVDDGRLSPLQLPPQIVRRSQNPSYFDRPMTPDSIAAGEYRGREQSYDSVSTIRPSECLEQRTSAPYASVQRSLRNLDRVDEESVHWKKDDGSVYLPDNDSVYQGTSPCHYLDDESALPIFRSESVLYLEDDHDNHSDLSSTSKVVLMKLPRNKNIAPTLIQRCSTRQTYVGSDEGYDDEDEDDLYGHHKEMPIDSDSVFLPISEQDQSPLVCRDTLRDSAATKIQAVWRGYQCRKTRPNVSKLVIDLVRVCDGIHRRHLHQTDTRVRQLEARLQEETAMRVAFEKAMEQMTVLVDQREKVLYDRIEQEVAMREAYERKMEYTLSQIQPLESNLKREVKARYEMESMLSRVLDQMQSIENARQQQAQDEAKARNVMQRQLDDALYQLAELKKQRKQQQDTPPAKIRAHEVGNKSTLSVASSVRPHTPSAAARPVSRLTARSTNKDVSPPATTVARPTTSMRHRPLQSTTARSLVQPKPLASATTVSTRASRASLRSPLTVRSTASRTDIRQGTMSTVKRTTAMVSSRG